METTVLTSKVRIVDLAVLRALARGLHGVVERGAHRWAGTGKEDDLAVGRLSHGLHGFEVADLHGRSGTEDVGGLTHQLGGFDLEVLLVMNSMATREWTYLGLCSDDLAFTDTLALGGHRE